MNLYPFLFPKNEEEYILRKLFQIICVKVSTGTIQEFINGSMSFVSLKQLLNALSIRNLLIQLPYDELPTIPLPAIASTKGYGYIIITNVKSLEEISVFSSLKRQSLNIKARDFQNQWDGKLLLLETNFFSKDKNYKQNRIKHLVNRGIHLISLIFYFVITAITFYNFRSSTIFSFLQTIYFTGVFISFALLSKNFGSHNLLSKNICTDKNGIDNCTNVLSSKYAKLFGFIHLSELVLIYFCSKFLILGILGLTIIDFSIPTLLVLPTIMALCFSFTSIYIQWVKLKKWCLLCLLTSLLIWIESIFLIPNLTLSNLEMNSNLAALFGFAVTWIFWFSVKLSFFDLPKNKRDNIQDQKMIWNKTLFSSLLKGIDDVSYSNDQGLFIGNNQSTNTLTLVIHLQCKYCRDAYEELVNLMYMNDNIRLDIKLAYSNHDKKQVASIFHAYKRLGNHDFILLLKSYLQNKNPKILEPTLVNVEESFVQSQIIENDDFIKRNQIKSYPAFIYNNKIVPTIYTAFDLKLLLA